MSRICLILQGPSAPIHIGHMHAPQVSASDSLNVTETEYFGHELHPIRNVYMTSLAFPVTIYKKDGIGLVG